ncbi:unnamed protein product [Prorocentrum cordatum]|uniref:Uncharacterized protein n=1 Tax=Prorocentrum cordatum TaxID=2364126 RepID=A0ABN9VVT0_9DINO|nr:unnamed protein product [Polarella glacialis]
MLRPVPDFSSNREQWFEVWGGGAAPSPAVILCAFYPKHGGDTDTWKSIVAHAALCRHRYPRARLILGGDANVHLDYLADHVEPCSCAHCKQSPADREIQQWLVAAGLGAFNPPAPTHVSGTCIDLFIGMRDSPLPVKVLPDFIALSDHRLVMAEVPCQFTAPWAAGYGRVAWTSGPRWDEGLREISGTLSALSESVEAITCAPWLQPPWFGGRASRVPRRAVVNVAAWARDAAYTMVGHAAGATKAIGGKRRLSQTIARRLLNPACFTSHQEFKLEVARAAWGERRRAVHRYLHLREANPGAAERFLSSFFQVRTRFEVRLSDPSTGAALTPSAMVEAVRQDLFARDRNDFEQDPGAEEAMARQGGVGDALTLVIGLVVHAQLRHAQGLHTWWALADGKWAFDVASRHAMLVGVYNAGVRGPDWLILDDVLEVTPPAQCVEPPRGELQLDGVVQEVSLLAAAEESPWPQARRFLRGVLSALSSQADRVAVTERLGAYHVESPQFVDDITTPCPSEGAVRAVLSEEEWSACSRYARRVRARFNYDRGKTAVLPLLDAAPPLLAGAPVVSAKGLLGVLVDSGLTFLPLLHSTLARGRSLFDELLQAAECGGFSIPVAAAQVPPRIESVILYASPLLALAEGAEAALNRLQVEWGRKLLGCNAGPPVRHSVVVAQCGWPLRLGTKFLERALLARARLAVLPLDHPASRAWQASRCLHAPSWVTAVAALAGRLPSPPVQLDRHPACAGEQLEAARAHPARRRALLEWYRWQVVRPALLEYDRQAFRKAASCVLPALRRSFAELCPGPSLPDWNLLGWESSPNFWKHYRLWAVIRMTGCWPLAVLGQGGLPATLSRCGACGASNVAVDHPLVACQATVQHRALLARDGPPMQGAAPEFALQVLFSEGGAQGASV